MVVDNSADKVHRDHHYGHNVLLSSRLDKSQDE